MPVRRHADRNRPAFRDKLFPDTLDSKTTIQCFHTSSFIAGVMLRIAKIHPCAPDNVRLAAPR